MFKKFLLGFTLLIALTPLILVTIGNVNPPIIKGKSLTEVQIKKSSHFYSKKKAGVHQVFLNGNDFERGQQYGYWTQDFLYKQEEAMIKKLDEVVPNKIVQYGIFFFSMGWFYGLDSYFKKEWLNEMYGVSLYGSKENLYFATPFTRQLAYHGIHDMGQMMIDQGLVLGACTQAATPQKGGGWLIGRNFDFEAGKIFDEDKVLKWVFPDQGIPFVSVIFSGMVGVLTGINQKGVYIAINAAGSEDRTRLGTPATLVLLDALQYSHTALEAVERLKQAKPLITDIYVVADRSDTLYVVEKSPEKTRVLKNTKSNVTTNHLRHKDWKQDSINNNRMKNNTTLARFERAKELLSTVKTPHQMADLLRDKVKQNNQIAWGHRGSIDAMIASHAVIYNSQKNHLYVSKGPSLSQEFIGLDLEKSFQKKQPVPIGNIPPDLDYPTSSSFEDLKEQSKRLIEVRKIAEEGECDKANKVLEKIPSELFSSHYYFTWAKAQLALCRKENKQAKDWFRQTLSLKPAYLREKEVLEHEIKSL